jgi:arylformamidase
LDCVIIINILKNFKDRTQMNVSTLSRFFVLIAILVVTSSFAQQRKEDFRSYYRIANIPYNDRKADKLNQLDVYMPKKGSKSPVILWVHGGNWIGGDKSEIDKKPEFFTRKGYIFISVNHRLSPEASYTGQAQDIANAIVWVYNNIIHYSGDKSKILLMGHETGAHLAATVVVNDTYLKRAEGSTSMIKGVVSVDGLGFYIPPLLPEQGSKFREGCQKAIGNSKDLWIKASPSVHITPQEKLPPFLLLCSGTNPSYAADAKTMAEKLSTGATKNKVVHYPQKNSTSISREIGKDGDKATEDIMGFLYECLK